MELRIAGSMRFCSTALFVCVLTHISVTGHAVYAQGAMVLEEVVVTARKREESLSDTPISITAFGATDLQRRQIDALDGIAAATPNLIIDAGTFVSGSSTAAGVFIRGIGQVDFSLTTEPGVGVYLDGVYIASSMGSVLDMVDVERVEVLRGPQGTLYGRNTIGGAINVMSRQAQAEFGGDLKVTAGAYDRIDVVGSFNVPLSDSLFAKVSAMTFNRKGFVDSPNGPSTDDLGDINRDGVRLALRFVPNDRFEAQFSTDYTRVREAGVPHVRVGSFEGASLALIAALANPASPAFVAPPAPLPAPSFIDLHNLLATTPIGFQGGIAGLTPGVVANPLFGQPTLGQGDVLDVQNDKLQNPSTIDLSSQSEILGFALNMSYDFGWSSVKSITSFRSVEATTAFDFGAVAQVAAQFDSHIESEQLSQELQLSGDAVEDRLHWLLGLYYSDTSGLHLDQVEFTSVAALGGAKIDNRSMASFAQATFDFTEKLSITGGLRYTYESKKFIVPNDCYALPSGAKTRLDGSQVSCAQLHSIVDPRFLNPGFLAFVNAPVFPNPGGRLCCLPVSDAAGNLVGLVPGYAAGDELLPRGTTRESFNAVTPHANIAYRWNEDFMSYFSYSEGFKSGGFVQRVFPAKTAPPSFEQETAKVYEIGFKWSGFNNRVSATAAGFFTEYDALQIQVNDGFAPVLRNAAAAEIKGFEMEISAIPAAGWLLQGGVGFLHAEYTKLDPDEDFTTDIRSITLDSELVNSPEWSTSLGIQYDYAISGGGQLLSRLDWSYQSGTSKDALNFSQLEQDAYHLLNVSMTYISPDDNWEVSVFGKNISDERYIVGGHANGLTQGWATAVLGRPAEWGVSLAYHFD